MAAGEFSGRRRNVPIGAGGAGAAHSPRLPAAVTVPPACLRGERGAAAREPRR